MRFRRLVRCTLGLLAVPTLAAAGVVVMPSSVSVKPTEATPFISVRLDFLTQGTGAGGTLEITPPPALVGSVTLEPNPVTYNWPSGTTSATTQFRLVTSAAAPAGTWTFNVADDTFGAGAATFTLTIREPEFDGVVSPSVVNLALGAAPASVRVATLPEPGFGRAVAWRVEGLPPFVATGGARASAAPSYPEVEFDLSLGAGAAVGTYNGTVRGTATGVPPVSRPLTVVVSTSSFNARLQPERLELVAGGPPAATTVLTDAPGVVSGAVTYTLLGLPPGVTASGARVSAAPGFPPVSFTVEASREAAAGTFRPRLRGVLEPGGVVTELPLDLRIARPRPQIQSVSPARLVRGALGQRLRIAGSDFEPGARVVARSAGILVRGVEVLGGGAIAAGVDVRADVPPGVALFDVVNPDGQSSPTPGQVAIVVDGSLGAPLAVHTVAVLHPAPGAQLSAGEALRPRGVLVVSGSGPLVVSWRLDGVVFDRSVVQARGGEPVAVEARAPIPGVGLGQHLLQLVVEGASELASEPVAVVQTSRPEDGHRILGPGDGWVVQAARPPLLSWTQVAGSSGYVVEVTGASGEVVARWPARGARLRPSTGDLARLGAGVLGWRVRPAFAGGVVGDPTPPRRLVLLPEAVRLEARLGRGDDGRLEISWSGGAAGLLYRVECAGAGGELLFAALTADALYRLPPSLVEPEGVWRVLAVAPGGEVLGTSDDLVPAQARVEAAPVFRFAAATEVELLVLSPAEGSVLTDALPTVGARWDGALDAAEVVLMVDATDVTAVARLAPDEVAFEPFLPLETGEHTVRLGLGEQVFEWSFRVALEDENGAEEGSPYDGGQDVDSGGDYGGDYGGDSGADRGGWRADLDLTATWLDGDGYESAESEVFATVSVSGESRAAGGFTQANVELSARQAIAPGDVFEEQNRSWVAEAGREGALSSQSLTVGYTAPDFLADTELVTAGYPKGGAQAALGAGPVRLAYYEAFDPDLEGALTGLSGTEQELRAAALEWPGASGRVNLRLVGVEVEEAPDPLFGGGGDGSLHGLYGSFRLGGASSLTLELARGEFTPSPESLETRAEGAAGRLALSTLRGAWTFDLGLRYVEADFVNPASRGLSIGGLPDRQGVEARAGRGWTGGNFDLGLRRFEGAGSGPGAVDSSLTGADLSLFQQLGERADVNFSLGYDVTASDGDPALVLPATDRADWNVALSLSERLGSFTVSQDVSLSESDDRLDRGGFSDSSQAGVSLQRSGEIFSLFALASAVRTRFGAERDASESLLVSLQPTWTWSGAGFSLAPYASYSRAEDDFSTGPTTTEGYRLTLTWSPPRLPWLSAVQLSGEGSRTEGPFALDADFVTRYTASLSMGWGKAGSGRNAAPPSSPFDGLQAGVLVPAAPGLSL